MLPKTDAFACGAAAQGNRIRVVCNGTLIVDWRDPEPRRIKAGPIGLQVCCIIRPCTLAPRRRENVPAMIQGCVCLDNRRACARRRSTSCLLTAPGRATRRH